MRIVCKCGLCLPAPGRKYHPKYGYDLDRVPGVHCSSCGEPIGNEPYVEDKILERFGTMRFRHKRCDDVMR